MTRPAPVVNMVLFKYSETKYALQISDIQPKLWVLYTIVCDDAMHGIRM